MPEVVFEHLLDIGLVTLGHTTLLPIHHKIITYSSGEAHPTQWMVFNHKKKKFESPDHISFYRNTRLQMSEMIDLFVKNATT